MAGKKAVPRKPSDKALEHVAVALRKLPERIDQACAELKWTKRKLSQESGVSETTLSRQPEGMSWWGVLALAKALGVRVGWLMGVEDQQWDERKRPSVRIADKVAREDAVSGPSGQDHSPHVKQRVSKAR